MLAAVPVSAGAVHVTVADASSAVAATLVGAPGGAGVGAVVVCDVSPPETLAGVRTALFESLHPKATASKATEAAPQLPLCLNRSTESPLPLYLVIARGTQPIGAVNGSQHRDFSLPLRTPELSAPRYRLSLQSDVRFARFRMCAPDIPRCVVRHEHSSPSN